MKVTILKRGRDGETLCFLVKDMADRVYELTNCHVKDTEGQYEGYFGSCDDADGHHTAHLNIHNGNEVELILSHYEDLSKMQ